MKRILIALGGNALQKAGEAATAENQLRVIKETSKYIADMIEDGYEVVIAHGNGPQVGRIVQQNDFAAVVTPAMPFDVCGAMSQGMIGYQIQQCLQNELFSRGIDRPVATVVTQVEVDPEDPKFKEPSKPIGQFYSFDEMKVQQKCNPSFIFAEDAGRGWRRVVPSPSPKRIVEGLVIERMVCSGAIIIAAGGGGIPVVRLPDGEICGTSAVIDKDLAAELLAEELNADTLMILTAVDQVCIHYRKPDQISLSEVTVDEAKRYMAQGEFAPGSMLPKMEAAVNFVESCPGRTALITSLEHIKDALAGKTGTVVRYTQSETVDSPFEKKVS